MLPAHTHGRGACSLIFQPSHSLLTTQLPLESRALSFLSLTYQPEGGRESSPLPFLVAISLLASPHPNFFPAQSHPHPPGHTLPHPSQGQQVGWVEEVIPLLLHLP